ncbi:hypothetical protein [Burkholderia gladioli]|uniref:hypothetical protein n=1 Tax=Burkholderia gladioli TaxID=28095 RepID=UPI0011D2A332|nr:hypothetical protein [Burkholderia gladioli]
MNTASKIVSGAFAGLFLAAAGAVALVSLGTFSQFMPPLPWTIGIALLVVAALVGVARGKFLGLGMVAFWACGVGFTLWIGSGIPDGGPIPMQNLYAMIPWTFVACCALAIVLNTGL